MPLETPTTMPHRYLDLLKAALARLPLADDEYTTQLVEVPTSGRRSRWIVPPIQKVLAKKNLQLARVVSKEARAEGRDWPAHAETMIGRQRLDNIQFCIESVLANDVPGDVIETGVWRGGATILMRGILAAYDVEDRDVWVADSFQGLPPPDPDTFPADKDLDFSVFDELTVDLDTVRANFARYGLLDDRVRFLVGWFKDTLPQAPIEQLAVLRLDGDYYESTWESLTYLYPKLSSGGYVIIDDFNDIPACRQGVTDYREQEGINTPIVTIDHSGVYWQKE